MKNDFVLKELDILIIPVILRKLLLATDKLYLKVL